VNRPVFSAAARLLAIALGLGAIAAQAADAPASPADAIRSQTLDNGMKVVVWPDHDIPNVALYVWYRAGGRNEYPGITGIAHYFEHMMFNGTATRAPGEFDRVMEANGGSNNAYTSSDVTVYQDWFPASTLELIFDLEADRMANLSFDPKVVESERGVVYSERRLRVDNDTFGALFEQVNATHWLAHPYQFPVIGWPSDIENWTMEDLKTFYRTYYAPNNATMFVVGDVDPDAVFALAKEKIGKIPAQEPPQKIRTVEPKQLGERRLSVRKEDAQTPLLLMAWHAFDAGHADTPALELLLDVLAQGDSSRLNQKLVENDPVAVNIGAYLHAGFDPGAAYLYAVLAPDADPAKVEAAIDAELARIIEQGVTPAELEKARNNKLAGFWRSQSTISGKAQALGTYEVFHGDYRKLFDAPGAYDAIDADTLRRVATEVFRSDNRTVGVLLPTAAQ